MAEFYLDHNVPRRIAVLLRTAGHGATTTRELGREHASDARQLRAAASRGWILVTHDDDFARLHDDWQHRPTMLRSLSVHAGILLIPASPIRGPERAVAEISALIHLQASLLGTLCE